MSWGTWPLFLKQVEKRGPVHASVEGAMLMAVIAIGTLPLAIAAQHTRRSEGAAARKRGDWLAMAWLGIGDAGNVLLFFAAYQKTSVAVAILTHYLTPVIVALLAPLVLTERAAKATFISVLFSFCVLALLLEPWNGPGRPDDRMGALLGAGSAVFYASNVLVQKRMGRVFTAGELMFYHSLVSCPLLLATVPVGAFSALDASSFGWLVAGCIGPGVIGGVLFVVGLARVPASHASTLTLLEPLVAVLVATLVFGERKGVISLVGGLFILAGAALVVYRGREAA